MAMNREIHNAENVPAPIGPYSHAVRHGEILYCTGQLPLDPKTGALAGSSPGEQARICLQNLELVCRSAGTGLKNALRVGIYAVDLGAFGEINEVYGSFFAAGPPARTTIGVASLPMGAGVELDAIVAMPGG